METKPNLIFLACQFIYGVAQLVTYTPYAKIPLFANLLLYSAITLNQCGNIKLDGVGPVDNRPSTNKLHHIVKKKKKKKITCDM